METNTVDDKPKLEINIGRLNMNDPMKISQKERRWEKKTSIYNSINVLTDILCAQQNVA